MRPRKPKPGKAQGPHFRWIGIEEPSHAPRRFYRLDTLASATEGMLRTGRGFFIAAAEALLGAAPLTSFAFEFVGENPYRLLFRVSAGNARQKRGSLLFAAAKNDRELSQQLEAEWNHLNAVHRGAPQFVPRPLRAGTVYLPDRHRRQGMDRKVFCYVSQWPGAVEELRTGPGLQFYLAGAKPRALSKPLCETIREGLMELGLRAFDPQRRTGLDIGMLAPSDIWAVLPGKGAPRLWLGACRRLETAWSAEKTLHRLIHAFWRAEDEPCPLAPADPEVFRKVVMRVWGAETGAEALSRYRHAVSVRKLKRPPEGYAGLILP